MKTEIELKPCPFCGGKAAISRTKESGTKAYCKDCGCATPRYIGVLEESNAEKEMAAQVWNNRTSGWISVRDRLPEEETPELLFSAGGKVYYGSFGYSKFYAIDNSGIYGFTTYEVTHWMPLPEPPTLEGEE